MTKETQESVHLSQFVGVWADYKDVALYRFSPVGVWYRYTQEGEVDARGSLSLNEDQLELLTEEKDERILLAVVSTEELSDPEKGSLHRVDAPSALSKAEDFMPYFDTWYEGGDLEGNTLTIEASSHWILSDPEHVVLSEGIFTVFQEEEKTPYLFTGEEEFFATLSLEEEGLSLKRFVRGQETESVFRTEENSTSFYAYFKDKNIELNYELGSGPRLLRNGGAVYNDQRDYKRMSVNCRVDADSYQVENGMASFDLSVIYTFRKTDMPAMTGRIYNTVRFSQYDYYTGQILSMSDSKGNEAQNCSWEIERENETDRIDCEFSSDWEYPGSEEAMVRWIGTYHLTMPESYDGFVICLRPVFNSYASQLSSDTLLTDDVRALDDLGEDVSKCLFCRVIPENIAKAEKKSLFEVVEVVR